MRARMWVPGVLLLAACGGDDEADALAAADSSNVENAAAVGDLLSPVRAVSNSLVELSQRAARESTVADVRQYAATVGTDHRAVILTLDSVAQSRGATLSQTESARDLENTVRSAHAGLDVLPAGDHDLAYIRAQVESHRQMLERLETELLPRATSADMRTLLGDLQAMEAAHLTRARQLLAVLLEGGAATPAPEPPGATVPAPTPAAPPVTTGG